MLRAAQLLNWGFDVTVASGIVRVGGSTLSVEEARGIIERLTGARDSGAKVFRGFPAYDTYRGGAGRLLEDSDLLAPALLNVRITLKAHYSLLSVMPQLNALLANIEPKADLLTAPGEWEEPVHALFRVLDTDAVPGVRGTYLAKVLHRMRPHLIPLYDEQVRRCYQDLPEAPLPRVVGRTWADFYVAFAREVRGDLLAHAEEWLQVREGTDVADRPLRALDLVAWARGSSINGSASEGRDDLDETD